MGAEPYWYFTKYQPDVDAALRELREREFAAGRYNPVTPLPTFPPDESSPGPGAGHGSIEEALAEAGADGTRSILDLFGVSEGPEFCAAAPVPEEALRSLYGTTRPTRAAVERNLGFLEEVDRGHGVYVVLYEGGEPAGLCFAGYSFD